MKPLVPAMIGIGALLLTVGARPDPLLVWNASASVPVGLYAVLPMGRLTVADLVIIRPPEALADWLARDGHLPKGLPLLKRIAALPGQSICRRNAAILIDSEVRATARDRDHAGRKLPVWRGCRRLRGGELFVLNADQPASLDGRYFGSLPAAAVIGRALPIWTREAP